MLYDIHRNMFKNKYTARPEDHHYSHGKPNTNRDPPSTGYSRPPKSCNKTCYNKSRKVFEKTTKNRYIETSSSEGPDFGKVTNLWEKLAVSESRLEMMGSMVKRKVGFNEVEDFVSKMDRKRTEKEKKGGG